MTDLFDPGTTKAAVRRRQVADHVVAHGAATASGLAELFGVSLMTIHRDLDELERHGIVRKHHGGVTAQPSSVFESHLAYRKARAGDAKLKMARAARQLIEPGTSVMLDDSSSALVLAEQLHDALPLTVITNFLEVIRLVTTWPEARVIALGGEYNPSHDSFLGVPCVEATAALHADVLVASVSTVQGGFVYHQEQDIVFVKRAMIAAASKRILLVDHTKLDRAALHRLAPLTDFDVVITDDEAPPEQVRQMRETGIEVIVATGAPAVEDTKGTAS